VDFKDDALLVANPRHIDTFRARQIQRFRGRVGSGTLKSDGITQKKIQRWLFTVSSACPRADAMRFANGLVVDFFYPAEEKWPVALSHPHAFEAGYCCAEIAADESVRVFRCATCR
jgi:hypothetical protein